jgi:hypothetical protein
VRKKIRFWQKRSPNCDFLVLHSPSTLSTYKNIWRLGSSWGVRWARFGWEKFSIVFTPYSIDKHAEVFFRNFVDKGGVEKQFLGQKFIKLKILQGAWQNHARARDISWQNLRQTSSMHCGQIQQMLGVDIFISKKIDVDISFLALAITHWLVPLAYQLLSCTS